MEVDLGVRSDINNRFLIFECRDLFPLLRYVQIEIDVEVQIYLRVRIQLSMDCLFSLPQESQVFLQASNVYDVVAWFWMVLIIVACHPLFFIASKIQQRMFQPLFFLLLYISDLLHHFASLLSCPFGLCAETSLLLVCESLCVSFLSISGLQPATLYVETDP